MLNSFYLGQSLKKWRLHRGITLKELKHRTGLNLNYLLALENGQRRGTPNQWIRIAKELNIPFEQFTSDLSELSCPTCNDYIKFLDNYLKIY